MGDELILVVDDDPVLRETVYKFLQASKYRVMMAPGGIGGLKLARAHRPDLILLDYQLGDINAPEVIEALNRRQLDIPVILMTGHGSEQIAVEVFRQGVRDYLIKPFPEKELLHAVERSLTEARLRQQNEHLTAELTATIAKLSQRNHALKQRHQELNVLFNVAKSFTGAVTPDGLLQLVVGAAVMLTECGEGGLFLIENGELLRRAAKSQADQHPRTLREPARDPLARQAVNTRQVVLDDGLAAPMIVANRPVGALVVRAPVNGARTFTDLDRNLLTMLSNIAAAVFDGMRLNPAIGGGGAPNPKGVVLPGPPPQERSKIIFISHSSRDWDAYVSPLVRHLREAGLQTWVYKHERKAGRDFMDTLNEMLERAGCLVLCATPNAMESPYVRMEYRYFFHWQKPIIPVICEPVRLPAELIGLVNVPCHATDLLVKLLNDLLQGP